MKSYAIRHAALLTAIISVMSCARPQHPEPKQRIVTESRALEIAKTAFLKTGRNVSDYNVSLKSDSIGNKWVVCFDEKGRYAVPGGKHLVTVEKLTGKATFMQGQ